MYFYFNDFLRCLLSSADCWSPYGRGLYDESLSFFPQYWWGLKYPTFLRCVN